RGATLNVTSGVVSEIPLLKLEKNRAGIAKEIAQLAINLAKEDWDSFETAFDFKRSPLLEVSVYGTALFEAYSALRGRWNESFSRLHNVEEENNKLFIDEYGLHEEL